MEGNLSFCREGISAEDENKLEGIENQFRLYRSLKNILLIKMNPTTQRKKKKLP